MLFAGLDLQYITQQFDTATLSVVEASHSTGSAADETDHSPSMLQQAMLRLLELLQIVEQQGVEAALSGEELDLNQLGDFAIQILSDLSSVANSLSLEPESQQLEDLILPMAIWVARQGGKLRSLAPIVKALAQFANNLSDPESLGQLYRLSNEVQQAVDETTRQNLKVPNPGHPWRLLLLDQAIIATRSHQADLIERAYDDIVQALPEEAPRFFAQGMQQMELLNYPQVVRQVVEKYYKTWTPHRTLH
jgi:hypothetical protein